MGKLGWPISSPKDEWTRNFQFGRLLRSILQDGLLPSTINHPLLHLYIGGVPPKRSFAVPLKRVATPLNQPNVE